MGASRRACSQHDRWQTSNLCPWCHKKSWTHHYAPLFLREPPLFQVSTKIWKNINRIQEVIINLHEKINYVCKVSKLGHDLLFCPTKIEGFILDLGEYIFFFTLAINLYYATICQICIIVEHEHLFSWSFSWFHNHTDKRNCERRSSHQPFEHIERKNKLLMNDISTWTLKFKISVRLQN